MSPVQPDFVVVAAVNDRQILADCLQRSPDIASGRVQLVIIENASSSSAAYNQGLAQSVGDVVLFAHQDVYLPAGTFEKLGALVNKISASFPDWALLGPDGKSGDGQHHSNIWDSALGRWVGQPGFPPTPVESFDELLLILRRSSGVRFDEALPDWHLYGTDIVQIARSAGKEALAIDLPVIHNSRPITTIMGGYRKAYQFMRRKWQHRLPIHTSVTTISQNPYYFWRTQWRRRHFSVEDRRRAPQYDVTEIAKTIREN